MARLAAVLVATALLLSGCGDGSSSTPHDAVAGPSTVDRPFRCPDPKIGNPRDHGSERLPKGATAALLCYRATDAPWSAPTGPLKSHVDRLVQLVNARRAVHYQACNLTGGPAWSIVFRYDNGTRTIQGDLGGCNTFWIGSTERRGAEVPFLAFLRALVAQRRASTPPDHVVRELGCPSRPLDAISLAAQPAHLATATWCLRRGRHWVRARAATADELRLLRHEFARGRRGDVLRRALRCHGLPRSTYAFVVGRDAWGEAIASSLTCDVYQLLPPGERHFQFIRMPPTMRRVVARVVTNAALRP